MMNLEFPPPLIAADAGRVAQENSSLQASNDAGSRVVNTIVNTASADPELSQVLEASAKFFQQHQQHLSFSVDESSGRMVVSVIDSKTSEVIKQIPGDEVLAISRRLQQMIEENSNTDGGLLVEQKT